MMVTNIQLSNWRFQTHLTLSTPVKTCWLILLVELISSKSVTKRRSNSSPHKFLKAASLSSGFSFLQPLPLP
jgi:hypothetical protein